MKPPQTSETNWPARTAGRLLITKIPVVSPKATIAQVEKLLLKKTKDFDSINYIYVVNAHQKLVGVLSVKDVFRLAKSTPVKEVMVMEPVVARGHTDQERVALLALKHNLKAIPLVDKNSRFLGVVPSDAILYTLNSEVINDFLMSAGIQGLKDPVRMITRASALTHFRKRLPWLVLGLFGGILAALVVGSYEEAIKADLILAAFIPTVVYLADAVGSQAQTIFIRSVAVDRELRLGKYIWREARITLAIAAVLTILISSITFIWQSSFLIASILGLAIFSTVLIAAFVAIIMPWLLSRLKFDPAFASGPFATIIRDLLSIIIYFMIAQTMFALFRG